MTVLERIRFLMSGFAFWIAVAYALFAVGLPIIVWSYLGIDRQQDRQAAASQAAYERCVSSIGTLTRLNAFLVGTNAIADIVVERTNALEAIGDALIAHHSLELAQTDPATAEYAQRAVTLRRVQAALVKISREQSEEAQRLIRLVRPFDVPTVEECAARRDR